MSTTGPLTERTVLAVLQSLWHKPETTLQALLRGTLAPLPDVQEALMVLRQRRCLIEQTPTGVRLVSTGLPCWTDILEGIAGAKKMRIGRRVVVYLRTGSTNDVAWQFAANEDGDGLVVVADEQLAGRGRQGHVWLAKSEQSVLLSVLLRQHGGAAAPPPVEKLTLLAGLATASALEQVARAATGRSINVDIKWPNDLMMAGRKLAGVLVEQRQGHVVIGIGINVTQGGGDFPASVATRATSLYQETGVLIDRLRVAEALLEHLDRLCTDRVEGLSDEWLAEWKARCGMLGESITARSGNRVLRGRVVDVDPLQGLVMRDEAGAMHFLSAQTTTLSDGQ